MRVVRLGSARAAASELGLSPSALSRRVSNLEEFVGKKLFSRSGQTMKLTEEGRAFYDAVSPQFEALAVAVETHSENLQLLRLRLGVPPLYSTQRLFPRMPELRKLHPRLHIDIDTGPNLTSRVGDTLDAAILLALRPDPSFYSLQLEQNKVRALSSREIANELGPHPTEAVLREQTFLIHSDLPKSFDAWREAVGMPNLQPNAVDHYDSGQLLLEAAKQGLGIAIMHDDHLKRATDERLAQVFDVDVDSPYSYWFVCRPIDLEQRQVRLFHDWLVSAGI